MEKLHYLNQNIRHGDVKLVASIVGCSEDLVKRVLLDAGNPLKRNHNTKTGRKIIAALEDVIDMRFKLKRKYSNKQEAAA